MKKNSVKPKALGLLSTVAAQAVWSGTNFVVVALLARHLSVTDFGILGIYLTIKRGVMLTAGALLIVPMTVISANMSAEDQKAYTSRLTNTVLRSVLALLLLGGLAKYIGGWPAPEIMILLLGAIAVEVQRRNDYLDGRISADMAGAVFNVIGVLSCLAMLISAELLTLYRAIFVVGLFNLAWVILASGRRLAGSGTAKSSDWTEMWRVGGWGLGSSLATYLYSQINTFYTFLIIGPAGVAVLELGRQFVGALQPVLFGMANYFQPRLAISAQQDTSAKFTAKLWRLTAVQVAFGALVMIAVLAAFPFLLSFIVPEKKLALYEGSMSVAVALAVATLLQIGWRQPGFAVVALGSPVYGFVTKVAAALVAVPIGFFLTANYGVIGAAWTKVVGDALILILSVTMLYRALREHES